MVIDVDEDTKALEGLAKKHGTAWVVARLIELGGEQLLLLHLGNSLLERTGTKDCGLELLDLINRLDELYGWFGSLNAALNDLHEGGFPNEPKPRVISAYRLDLGDDTEAILEECRRKGYVTKGKEVRVRYGRGADPYVGTEAADLEEDIWLISEGLGVDLGQDSNDRIVPVWGVGPGA